MATVEESSVNAGTEQPSNGRHGGRRGAAARALGLPIAAFALVGTVGSAASEEVIEGRLFGTGDADGVWLGIAGDASEEASWIFVEGGSFAVPAPGQGRATLVAMARNRLPLVVPVPAGAPRPFLELRLSPGLELAGSVRSEDGLPLAGATIRVAPRHATVRNDEACGSATPLRSAKITVPSAAGNLDVPPTARPSWETSRAGTFRVGGLESGRHFVEAVAEGHMPLLLEEVEIRKGEANRVELELSRATFVAGRAVVRNGGLAAGIEVQAEWAGRRFADSANAELRRHYCWGELTVQAGADGSYRLGPFEAGQRVRVTASAPELGETGTHVAHAPRDDLALQFRRRMVRGRVLDDETGEPIGRFQVATHGDRYDRQPDIHPMQHPEGRFAVPVDGAVRSIVVEAPGRFPRSARIFAGSSGEYDLGDIALAPARSITGRIRDGRSGEPIAGVNVSRMWRRHEDEAERIAARRIDPRGTQTDENGTFALGPMPLHADALNVHVQGHGGRLIVLPPDVSHIEIELTFDATIAGSLELPDGTPVQGEILLSQLGLSRERAVFGGGVLDDGTFRFAGLGGGKYRITSKSAAGVSEDRIVTLRDGESMEGVRIVVDPGGRIAGSITGLVRAEEATVAIWGSATGRAVLQQTFGNGPYSLRGAPEQVTVAARTSSGRLLERIVRLDDDGEARVDLDFSAASRLSGTVTSGGRPVAGLELWIVPEGRSTPLAHTTTGPEGGYSVRGIADGRHAVQTRAGHAFDVHVAEHSRLDIELPPISLSGTVRAARTGEPVAGGWARLERADASGDAARPTVHGARVDGDGTFRFDGLVEGEYVVSVSHRSYQDAVRQLHVAGREVIDLRLDDADDANAPMRSR